MNQRFKALTSSRHNKLGNWQLQIQTNYQPVWASYVVWAMCVIVLSCPPCAELRPLFYRKEKPLRSTQGWDPFYVCEGERFPKAPSTENMWTMSSLVKELASWSPKQTWKDCIWKHVEEWSSVVQSKKDFLEFFAERDTLVCVDSKRESLCMHSVALQQRDPPFLSAVYFVDHCMSWCLMLHSNPAWLFTPQWLVLIQSVSQDLQTMDYIQTECPLYWFRSWILDSNLLSADADCMWVVQHEGNNSSEHIIQ